MSLNDERHSQGDLPELPLRVGFGGGVDRELNSDFQLDQMTAQIEQTLGYVRVVARRFVRQGISQDELIAAGNLGLVEAALRFDPSRNVKFITYADWWIRKTIRGALQAVGPVRLPGFQHDRLRSLRDAQREFLNLHGYEPDAQDLSAATGLPRPEIDRLLHLRKGPVSIDRPESPSGERPLKEALVDPDSEDLSQEIARRDLTTRLRTLLGSLGERELRVISLRFGIDGQEPLTLRQAGRCLGISRERVRQLEIRALGKLKQLI